MKRPGVQWAWLLADVSLDRAATVLPLLGFPPDSHGAVQACIDAVAAFPGAFPAAASDAPQADLPLAQALDAELRRRFGDARSAVEQWLHQFPFTHDSVRPDWFYWAARLDDLLLHDPAETPAGMAAPDWQALCAAYRGTATQAPAAGSQREGWTRALQEAAAPRAHLLAVDRAIDAARTQVLSAHDLPVYMRMGWNDEGTQPGLASLQIGARMQALIGFWRAVQPLVPAAPLESLAQARDMAAWRAAADPSAFAAAALRYGVPAEQMAADVFPRPAPPPPLAGLALD